MKKFWNKISGEIIYRFLQFKSWLADKYKWLKTFNKPPKVIINADCILGTHGKYAIEQQGRTSLTIHGNIFCAPGIEGKKWVHHKGDITVDGVTTKDVTFIVYE